MPDSILPLSFYAAYDTRSLAEKLLGCELVHESPDGITSGIIVETEAYLEDDPASHAFNGPTPRNLAMFAAGGTVYIYRSYGIHLCLNISTGAAGVGAAVLIRALQPHYGIPAMAARRGLLPTQLRELASGPGKLAQALGLTLAMSGNPLANGFIQVYAGEPLACIATRRIGISKNQEALLRFVARDCAFVSRSVKGVAPAGGRSRAAL